ncbi:MAG: PqqD family protein [Bacteroidales bacterium]|nr:PqqD family protein [Bacteroidales bacterium]MBR5072679.1 PqqD family protein [Bacteroidales bacterium]
MKIVEGFRLRPLGKEFIVTPESVAQINFNKMISLNSSAAYLWKSVEGKEFTAETLRDLLLERYDVSEEIAMRDAENIARTWVEAGIAEE